MGALNDSNGTFLSSGPSAERQDRICKRVAHDKFIMYLIVANIVHGSGQFAGLAKHRAGWSLSFVRQPGECRNLRMGHSVGHQDLVSLRVVPDRSGVTNVESCGVGRSSPDYSQRLEISVCPPRKHKY